MPHRTARPPLSQEPGAGSYTAPEPRSTSQLLKQLAEGVTVVAFVSGLVGSLVGFIGVKVMGPSEQLRHVESQELARDSQQVRNLDTLATGVRSNTVRITSLEQEQQLQRYMLCIITRRVVPEAVPPQCGQTALPLPH